MKRIVVETVPKDPVSPLFFLQKGKKPSKREYALFDEVSRWIKRKINNE